MSAKTCSNCGNLQARGRYCSQCGFDLSNVLEEPLIVAPSRRSYEALRFVSSMMILLGWFVIIGSLILASVFYSQFVTGGNAIVYQGQDTSLREIPVRFMSAELSALIIGLFGIVFGAGEIAAGQIIMVVLDIRDDVRKMASKDS